MKKRIVSMVFVWMLFLSVLLGTQFSTVAATQTGKVIIYDNGHAPHIDQYAAASFINVMREYGTVQISSSAITPELLGNAMLLVIPSPDEAVIHTAAEIQAIKDYVENGGALLIMGTYYAYFDPSFYDPITSDYGIKWVDGSNSDMNDNDGAYLYFVLFDTFQDNELANRLKVGVENIKMSGTALNITVPVNVTVPVNAINVTVYPIVTGDDDPGENRTVTYDAGYEVIFNGTDVIPLAGVELTGGGKIIASGSDFFIRSDRYGFFDHNEQFLQSMLDWLLRAHHFGVTLGGTTYNVTILSNSTVNDFNFSQPERQISFNVTCTEGTTGFYQVNIPKALLSATPIGNWTIFLDDLNITDFAITESQKYTFIYFTYNHTTSKVEIKIIAGIPEFPIWPSVLLMLFLLTLGATIFKRKMQSLAKQSTDGDMR